MSTIPAGAIEILYDEQNQPWFKQVHVGEYISIANMRDATSKVDPEDKKSRAEITDGSYTPPKHAKPHDDFLSVNGVTTIVLNSRKPKARKVAAWLIRDIIPQTIEEEDHQHQLEIEEKDREYQQLIEEIRDFRDLVQNLNVERIGDKNTALAASYSGLLMIILGYLALNIFIRSCNLI